MGVNEESHRSYSETKESIIAAVKARCVENDYSGFVLEDSHTIVAHTGLCDYWPDPVEVTVRYLGKGFNGVTGLTHQGSKHSESTSGVRQTTTKFSVYYRNSVVTQNRKVAAAAQQKTE